ncbi:flavin reductase family protein [Lampropedia aestuarii]|uniref:flavin reductase family protein n=1 Tax=Lampropedia aestuarii TaxID=2562762 RepID=UPI0024683435|nr:flavin reductase family protein [Lampropedia aestuarii]MDH5858947.1 flavin reductase family protein [Lampropedia aestuarii]
MTEPVVSAVGMPIAAHLKSEFNARHLRDAFGHFATGVTVVTTLDAQGAPVGLTISSFSPVSLNPPLILWSLVNTASSREAFLQHPRFAINVLAADQHALALQFASRSPDRFKDVAVEFSASGLPLLTGALAWFECKRFVEHLAGDHTIFIGEVEQVGYRGPNPADLAQMAAPDTSQAAAPLIFHRGVLHQGGLSR